jgi:NAD(P)-dependent dehydrogenase (short-subunit alcohol dehydrogenase family)
MDVAGRVVVITGASRGLGAGMAEEMAKLGIRLGLCARSEPAIASGNHVLAERVDVSDREDVFAFAEHVIERFGRIDLWVNNAAVLDPVLFVRKMTGQQLMQHFSINVAGVLHGTQAFVEHVRTRAGEGVLVNISSGAAIKGYAGWSAYCAGKAAVDRLTECVQLEEQESGLRAYAVAPGVIDTDMQRRVRACTPEEFPEVEKFLQLERDGAFNTPGYVARKLLRIAFDPAARPASVVLRLPSER